MSGIEFRDGILVVKRPTSTRFSRKTFEDALERWVKRLDVEDEYERFKRA